MRPDRLTDLVFLPLYMIKRLIYRTFQESQGNPLVQNNTYELSNLCI